MQLSSFVGPVPATSKERRTRLRLCVRLINHFFSPIYWGKTNFNDTEFNAMGEVETMHLGAQYKIMPCTFGGVFQFQGYLVSGPGFKQAVLYE